MNKRDNTKSKDKNGITLIVLIVTIVVLLIISGVAISMITGEKGLFVKANSASFYYNEESEKEAIRLAISNLTFDLYANNSEAITAAKLEMILNLNGNNVSVIDETDSFKIIFNKSGKEYIINKDEYSLKLTGSNKSDVNIETEDSVDNTNKIENNYDDIVFDESVTSTWINCFASSTQAGYDFSNTNGSLFIKSTGANSSGDYYAVKTDKSYNLSKFDKIHCKLKSYTKSSWGMTGYIGFLDSLPNDGDTIGLPNTKNVYYLVKPDQDGLILTFDINSNLNNAYLFIAATGSTGELEFESIWLEKATYTITYDLNGGTGTIANQTKEKGEDITLSNVIPILSDNIFFGWSTNQNSTNVSYLPGSTFSENSNVTLYAVWCNTNNVVFYDNNVGTWINCFASSTQTGYDFSNTNGSLFIKSTGATGSGDYYAIKTDKSYNLSNYSKLHCKLKSYTKSSWGMTGYIGFLNSLPNNGDVIGTPSSQSVKYEIKPDQNGLILTFNINSSLSNAYLFVSAAGSTGELEFENIWLE